LIRTLSTDLAPGAGFRFRSNLPIHLEFAAFSKSTLTETHYIMELFDVELASEDARRSVDADMANRWLTPDEIRVGRTHDGRPVSPTMQRLLEAMTSALSIGVTSKTTFITTRPDASEDRPGAA